MAAPKEKIGGLERVALEHADAVLRMEAQCKKSVGQAHVAGHRRSRCALSCAALRIWVRTSIVSCPRSASQCQSR